MYWRLLALPFQLLFEVKIRPTATYKHIIMWAELAMSNLYSKRITVGLPHVLPQYAVELLLNLPIIDFFFFKPKKNPSFQDTSKAFDQVHKRCSMRCYSVPTVIFRFGGGPHQYFYRMSGATPESFTSRPIIITCYSILHGCPWDINVP